MLRLEPAPRSYDGWLVVWRRKLGVEGRGQLGEPTPGDVGPCLFSFDSHTATLGKSRRLQAWCTRGCGEGLEVTYAWKTPRPSVER